MKKLLTVSWFYRKTRL